MLFGLIAAGFGVFFKRYYKMSKKEQEEGRRKFKEELEENFDKRIKEERIELEKVDNNLQKRMDELQGSLTILSKGTLSI